MSQPGLLDEVIESLRTLPVALLDHLDLSLSFWIFRAHNTPLWFEDLIWVKEV